MACKCGLRQCGSFLVDGGCQVHGRPEQERKRVGYGYAPTSKGRKAWEANRAKHEAEEARKKQSAGL